MPPRILLLSGNRELIAEHVSKIAGKSNCQIIPLEEKKIVDVRHMYSLVTGGRMSVLCFACKDLELQRYQFILASYLFFANAKIKFIIDEHGMSRRFSALGFFLVDLPRFGVECIASVFIVLRTGLRLRRLKKHINGEMLYR